MSESPWAQLATLFSLSILYHCFLSWYTILSIYQWLPNMLKMVATEEYDECQEAHNLTRHKAGNLKKSKGSLKGLGLRCGMDARCCQWGTPTMPYSIFKTLSACFCISLSSALVVILCKMHPISTKLLSIDFSSEELQKRQGSKNKWHHDLIRAQAKSPGFSALCYYF